MWIFTVALRRCSGLILLHSLLLLAACAGTSTDANPAFVSVNITPSALLPTTPSTMPQTPSLSLFTEQNKPPIDGDSSHPVPPLDATAFISAYVAAENEQRWADVSAAWVKIEQYSYYEDFFADPQSQADYAGEFTIQSARLVEFKALPNRIAASYTDLLRHMDRYGAAHVFYVGIDYMVHRESATYYNGVNYRLLTLVPEYGVWQIAEFARAPVARLVRNGYGFASAPEQIAQTIDVARTHGRVINAHGEVLAILASCAVAPTEANSTSSLSNATLPAEPLQSVTIERPAPTDQSTTSTMGFLPFAPPRSMQPPLSACMLLLRMNSAGQKYALHGSRKNSHITNPSLLILKTKPTMLVSLLFNQRV